ncbi:MAG: CoA transferase [Acidimicrobiales bacterium]|nr:CoA transferase [Acidimicrobiales bacterium]
MEKSEFYRNARTDRTGPMHGVRVIEATTAWAGPMVGCVLADLGCDVVRVDLPGSAGSSWPPFLPGTDVAVSHQTVNRNKRSVSIDLHKTEGRDVFLQLVAGADIVVENFKPGTLAGWGVGYEHCKAVKDDIVYVSVSGWGQFGPWSERAGYDPAALAAGGWMSLNGAPDGAPTNAPTFLADDLAGLHAALGALAALHHRNATGEGQHVDIALLDSLLFQCNGLLTMGALGQNIPRMGGEVVASSPTNSYACTDGHLYLAIILDRHWRTLCQLMGRPELAEAPGFATNLERVANRDAVNEAVASWCATGTVAERLGAIQDAGIAAARVNSFTDAAAEPHVQERDMLQPTVITDGQEVPLTGPAAKFSRTPTAVRRPAPRAGDHTDEVLEEAGIDAEQRAKLRAAGVL